MGAYNCVRNWSLGDGNLRAFRSGSVKLSFCSFRLSVHGGGPLYWLVIVMPCFDLSHFCIFTKARPVLDMSVSHCVGYPGDFDRVGTSLLFSSMKLFVINLEKKKSMHWIFIELFIKSKEIIFPWNEKSMQWIIIELFIKSKEIIFPWN
jgi:hypothetical protein